MPTDSDQQSPDNRDQIDFWNGPAAERWVRHQVSLDRGLAPFSRAAIARLAPRAGERILDIGCGSGTTLLELAPVVGDTGAVVGVDPSRPLLELAQKRAASAGASNITLIEADAAQHAFTPSFHALFSRFGVMFFADPVRAFQNLKRALVPGGRLAFVCWQSLDANPWCGVPLAAARQALGELPAPLAAPAPDTHAPGPLAFADPERVRHVLTGAGFAQVELEPFRAPVLMSDEGVDAGIDAALRIGAVSRVYAELADPAREAVRRQLRSTLAAFMSGDALALDGAVWLVSARS
jgi:SAM-dependent methyltransferase